MRANECLGGSAPFHDQAPLVPGGPKCARRIMLTNENVAREVVPDVLGAPGTVEIELANANHAAVGCAATVADVEFSVGSIKLVEARSDLSGTDAAAIPVRADSSRRK